MNSSVTRCLNCHEMYENTMKGLEDHYYGDNPYARNCSRITEISSAVNNQGFWSKLFGRIPDVKNNALDELLQYKLDVNEYMTTQNDVSLEEFLRKKRCDE